VTTPTARIEELLRSLAPEIVAALVRRHGDFDASEDAAQEALLAAARQWPEDGLPRNPRGWLVAVASRRLIESQRSDAARRRREHRAVTLEQPLTAPEAMSNGDDTLTLYLLCCHPSLSPTSQVALTLRAVGGLTTAEIARALLVPEATVAQRISRAKRQLRDGGAPFELPPTDQRVGRIEALRRVLYLIFTEGSTASSGPALHRAELSTEAIRLARQLHALLPGDGEVAGLLALMLLTDARRPARTGPDGSLVPLAEQDRTRWDSAAIAEGTALVERALATKPIGPYQLQAAIAALHGEASRAEDTDWRQILALYELLGRVAPGPMVSLNRVVALAMVAGPEVGLAELAALGGDERLAGHHRYQAVRAHLLELAGRPAEARGAYLEAARRTLSIPEQRYLATRAARLARA
jgi:RNA polymerase sigma factor (sigma-70 family)